jgi:indolepyruvate ferredoxin oxidoreductase beta subunit
MRAAGPLGSGNGAPSGGSALAKPQASRRHPSRRNEPTTILIAALGGQGGGVLTDWIVHAARAENRIAQATSTPGVSQRTGATSYYVEIAAPGDCADAAPILGLAPVPGRVDILVCAELLEAARMLERGMSTPSRTTVVASTHRVYTTREKMSAADGRFDGERIVAAVRALSRRATLFDMEAIRARHGTAISAVLFGALAGSGVLPMSRAACADAIRAAGKGVDTSLAAFDEAFSRAREGDARTEAADAQAASRAPDAPLAALPPDLARGIAALPGPVAAIAAIGAAELVAYQDARYASTYLERVARVVIAEDRRATSPTRYPVACEAARSLALWMRYDDMIRVAQLKARASRLTRIRDEAGARGGEVVRVHDLFRPGALELAAILPARLGAWLERRALERRAAFSASLSSRGVIGTRTAPGRRLTLQTSSVSGALTLRMIAALRPFRPRSLRFAHEQRAIDDWLAAIDQALAADAAGAALDLARMARLIRGYGDTHATGRASFARILGAWRAQFAADPVCASASLRTHVAASLAAPGCEVAPVQRPGAAPAGSALPAVSARPGENPHAVPAAAHAR